MTESVPLTATVPWRRPSNPAWDYFKQRFWVNCWMNGSKLEPIEIALQYYLNPLKELADEEYWGEKDIFLVNYFVHTFYNLDRFNEEDRSIGYLKEHDNAIHFHTGLFTVRMEPIYAYFPINTNPGNRGTADKPQYFFNYNRPEDHFLLSCQMTNRCYPLPVRCRYFRDYSSLIMDATKKPEVDWKHIVDSNWERVCEALYPDQDPFLHGFKENAQLKVTSELCGALELALRRVEANYRTAVPQFYNTELQLLLPLCIRDPTVPDLVLTVARRPYVPAVEGKFTYVARTILTIPWAYQNARLIARPEHDWLQAPHIAYGDLAPHYDLNAS